MIRSALRAVGFTLLVGVCVHLSSSEIFAQKKTASDDPQALAFEVAALQTLHRLDLTDAQLELLQRVAKGAASPVKSTGQAKTTPAFVKGLTALRNALLEGDDDKIDDLKDKLLDIMEKDKIQIEDRVAISDPARRAASGVIRMLQPTQVLAYLQILDEDDVDLQDLLEEALERGATMTPGQWKTVRDSTAADGAWLLVGGDEARTRIAVKTLSTLLDQHHSAMAGKTVAPDLEKQVLQLTQSLDPFLILRNAMERDVAEMLSNPRLAGAIQHTQAERKKLAAK